MNNSSLPQDLPDLQKGSPTIDLQIPLTRVGVEGIKFPLRIASRVKQHAELKQLTLGDGEFDLVDIEANVNMYSDVPAEHRGTHMSRFLEVLMENQFERISMNKIPLILKQLQDRLHSNKVEIQILFTYFYPIEAPVTRKASIDDIRCELSGVLDGSVLTLYQGMKMIGTNCCPCSKEISERGAHNQRVELHTCFKVIQDAPLRWFEDCAETLKSCFSSSIFPLLKRPDEKFVTEKAYDNPKFSEDVAREAAKVLSVDWGLTDWYASATAHESIHHHNAVSVAQSANWEYPW